MRTAWASGFTRFTGAVGFLSLIPNIFAMKRYMEKQLEAVRIRGGEGLVAELVRVEKEGGQISRNEMVSMVFLLLFAGHETTTHLISGSVLELLKNPGLLDWLKEDWNRANLAVEEFLRLDAVARGRNAAAGVAVWPVVRRGVRAASIIAGVAVVAWLCLGNLVYCGWVAMRQNGTPTIEWDQVRITYNDKFTVDFSPGRRDDPKA